MRRSLYFLITLVLTMSVCAESMDELQKKKKRAQQNIEQTSHLISQTNEQKNESMAQVTLLSAQIKEHRNYINAINEELGHINRKISQVRADIATKQRELDGLKSEYAKLMYYQYFNKGKYEKLMFILSADSFAQGYRRYRYLKQYSEYCKAKGAEIAKVQKELDAKLAEVEEMRKARTSVLNEQKAENQKLQKAKSKQSALVTKLKKKERQLRADLKKQQKVANSINSQIEKIIAEEARKSSAGNKKGGSTSGTKYQPTKEETLVSKNFEGNKGKLPWPVEKGAITGYFGIQPHPVLERVTVNNKGIYMQCPPNSKCRAVFDGEVSQCFSVPGSNNIVIIKHGLYRTVYANLSRVLVKAGDKVTAKQQIGVVYTDTEDDNKTELYFQVWKDKDVHNPELWLAR